MRDKPYIDRIPTKDPLSMTGECVNCGSGACIIGGLHDELGQTLTLGCTRCHHIWGYVWGDSIQKKPRP